MIRAKKPVEGTDHQYIVDNLSAYLDGELLPGERDAVAQHLATCLECRWNLETLGQVSQWTSELPVLTVPRVYTIPAAIQPERASRRRPLFLPVLQGATALVALLLFFAMAGDFLVGGLRYGSAPQTLGVVETVAVEMEATMAPAMAAEPAEAPVEAPAAEAVATKAGEVVVEVTKEVELEVASKAMTEAPPPSALQATSMPAPTMVAEAVVTATPEEGVTAPGIGGPEGGEEATAQPQLEALPVAAPSTAEAMADMAMAATVLTPTVPVTPTWSGTPAPAVPTVVAEAGQREVPAPSEGGLPVARALREPGPNWWQVAVVALGGLFVVLLIATVVATIQYRRTR